MKCWSLLTTQLGRGEIGLRAGIAFGLIGQSAGLQRAAVIRIEADGVVEVGQRVEVVVFLEIGVPALGVIVGESNILAELFAVAGHRRVRARAELDGLAALRDGGIILLLEIVDRAAVKEGV